MLSIFVHIVHVLRLWPPFALLWIWTHNGANMDTARAVSAFGCVYSPRVVLLLFFLFGRVAALAYGGRSCVRRGLVQALQ